MFLSRGIQAIRLFLKTKDDPIPPQVTVALFCLILITELSNVYMYFPLFFTSLVLVGTGVNFSIENGIISVTHLERDLEFQHLRPVY